MDKLFFTLFVLLQKNLLSPCKHDTCTFQPSTSCA